MASDLVQSLDRDLDFQDLYYSLPADASHHVGPTQDLLMEVYETDVSDILKRVYRYPRKP
jgi:hypothetical protein